MRDIDGLMAGLATRRCLRQLLRMHLQLLSDSISPMAFWKRCPVNSAMSSSGRYHLLRLAQDSLAYACGAHAADLACP